MSNADPLKLAGLTFKSQRQAVRFLKDLGYKVTTATFSNHFREGHVPTNAQGQFDEATLRSYANLKLHTVTEKASAEGLQKTLERVSADSRLKTIQADRLELRYQKEQGLLISRAQHESDLGARAVFFRSEARNFINLHGAAIIHLVQGHEDLLPELIAYWLEHTAVWMDAWAQDRDFILDDEDEAASDDFLPEPAGGGPVGDDADEADSLDADAPEAGDAR